MADNTSYLPTREADLTLFSTNFNTRIVATPAAFGILAAQATAYTALHSAWITAYNAANAPLTRSKPYIDAKNTAKDNLINGPGGIRELVALIQAYPAITNQQLSDLGLTVRDHQPTPIPAPTVAPEIDFLVTGTRTIRLRMHNEKALKRKRPAGVKGAGVLYFVGETPPLDLNSWTFYTNTNKTVLDVNLPVSVGSGDTVWFTAFWFNPSIESGPATTPVSTRVQFGGLSKAA